MQELLFGSATAMAVAIRERQVSVVEVVEAHIARIEAVNARLNAVVQTAFERARKEAILADAALDSKQAIGALHGVPITLKDSIHIIVDRLAVFWRQLNAGRNPRGNRGSAIYK